MSDEKFEEFLQGAAASYNAPPATVPRDEMFAAITAARRDGAATPQRPASRPWITSYAWAGMAATLLIGVAIGRYVLEDRHAATTATPAARGASRSLASTPAEGVPPGRADPNGVSTYTHAATAQLERAEAFLTAYGASAGGGPKSAGMDRQLSTWARDILSNTRLLLDSPAAADPARRQLLQDLELVLVQMVQRSPAAGAAEERSQIDRSLGRTHVLSRLRSALPAGRTNGI